jgi:hypothetical protein
MPTKKCDNNMSWSVIKYYALICLKEPWNPSKYLSAATHPARGPAVRLRHLFAFRDCPFCGALERRRANNVASCPLRGSRSLQIKGRSGTTRFLRESDSFKICGSEYWNVANKTRSHLSESEKKQQKDGKLPCLALWGLMIDVAGMGSVTGRIS